MKQDKKDFSLNKKKCGKNNEKFSLTNQIAEKKPKKNPQGLKCCAKKNDDEKSKRKVSIFLSSIFHF